MNTAQTKPSLAKTIVIRNIEDRVYELPVDCVNCGNTCLHTSSGIGNGPTVCTGIYMTVLNKHWATLRKRVKDCFNL